MDPVSKFHAEASQATASESLAQVSYMAARVGFEPLTLRTKDDESTNRPTCPICDFVDDCDDRKDYNGNFDDNVNICKMQLRFDWFMISS